MQHDNLVNYSKNSPNEENQRLENPMEQSNADYSPMDNLTRMDW